MLVERIVDRFDGPLSEGAELAGGDVGSLSEGACGDGVAGLGECEEDGHVGDGSGDGSDIGEIRVEDLLGELDGLELDLVHVDVPLIVALPGKSLGVPVGKIRDQHFLGEGAHEVLRGDHGDRFLEPFVVLHHLLSDELGVFLCHGLSDG